MEQVKMCDDCGGDSGMAEFDVCVCGDWKF